MEVGTGRALSAVILVTWTATPGETARARRGSKNSSVRGCEWAPQLLHSCVPSPGPALFFFYLRSSFNILAEPSRARTEREREWPASDFYSARVQILASFLRPLVEQIFRRPRSSFAEEQTPNPPLAKGTANRFKRDRQSRYRSNVYQEGNENVGDLTDRAIFVEQRGHRLASSGQGALVLPPVPSSPPLVFETLKLPGCSNSWGRVLIVNRRGSRKWGRMISTEVVLEMISLS